MEDPLAGLEDAVGSLRDAWTGPRATAGPATNLARAELMRVLDRLGELSRRVDDLRAQVAAEIDRESRPELGVDSLARQQGYRSPAALIAATTGIGTGDAIRVVAVGKAIAPRQALTGEALPAKHPHVAESLHAGRIGQAAAAIIVAMLERVA